MKNPRSKRKRKKGKPFKPSESHVRARPCSNCGEQGPHFVPPSFGDPGFFICEKKEE